LPEIVKGGTDSIKYVYDAAGTKLAKLKNNAPVTYYAGNFVYNGSKQLDYIITEEGMVKKTGSQYSYEYYLKDHLGNIRTVFRPGPGGTIITEQVNAYYPFGMLFAKNNTDKNKYLYNGKELQDDVLNGTGVEWYDYGARMYDPQLGRWHVVDPLAERRIGWSPYAYCLNNPILRIDPNGLTDFTFDKKTGDVKQVGEKNDDPDRILKTNRKGEVKYKKNGEAKVAIGGIEQGILKDGQNFKNKDQVISVGGEGQPTVKGVEDFSLKLSEYVGTEIAGAYFTKEGSAVTTHMTIGNYKNNTLQSAKGHGHTEGIRQGLKLNEITGFYHTHPSTGISVSDRTRASEADINARDNALKLMPHMKFFIITSPLYYGADNEKIDYTNH